MVQSPNDQKTIALLTRNLKKAQEQIKKLTKEISIMKREKFTLANKIKKQQKMIKRLESDIDDLEK